MQFINICCSTSSTDQHVLLKPSQAYFHGAFLVFLDALGVGAIVNGQSASSAGELCSQFFLHQLKDVVEEVDGFDSDMKATVEAMDTEDNDNAMFTFGGFSILRGRSLFCLTSFLRYA